MLQNERKKKILGQLNARGAVKVHDLADELGISKFHLAHLFKQYTGKSIVQRTGNYMFWKKKKSKRKCRDSKGNVIFRNVPVL